ncbi:DUF1059 domain-containing protein [Luteibaculum oceani]|uniref:DUF1059 domain-containing protein n=1 Tax=Luteibaculum oceani TaxID=1294296 RepID=A0A5C6VDK8_9FLAO|nr:DUF1059 domain-containing protein [Luteibaculum oceani]TXC81785.1 DUF1059 domain-containing protein [Luteibaculum oceani]
MKKMTCKELGGACDVTFHANTFAEMAAQSKKHSVAMIKKGDTAHIQAMQEMQTMMQDPDQIAAWMTEKEDLFNNL